MTVTIKLEEEYHLIRAVLNDAGLDHDWRRWRDKSLSRTPIDRVAIDQADRCGLNILCSFAA